MPSKMIGSIRDACRKRLREQEFDPDLWAVFTQPFFIARKGLRDNIAGMAKHVRGRTLDVGCGIKPYEHLFDAESYVGLEIDTEENRRDSKAEYFYQGHEFPFANDSFDSVLVNQVLEHVFNPDEFLGEVNRVLSDGGVFLLTVPFVWDEHLQPYDYGRYSSFGLRFILSKHGFVIVEHRKSVNDIRVVFQLLNDYIYKKTLTSNPYLNLTAAVALMAPINILGEGLARILPKNDDLYLDNVVLAVKNDDAPDLNAGMAVHGA
jgi:SAM-dependent methyltransferase